MKSFSAPPFKLILFMNHANSQLIKKGEVYSLAPAGTMSTSPFINLKGYIPTLHLTSKG